jgi:16S rRNA (cytosine1402-N4)-methyltransferase
MTEKNSDNLHYSVLKQESLDSLCLAPGLTVVDATVNRAGHATEIAKAIGNTGTLIIFDLDKEALDYSTKKLESLENGPKIIPIHSNYRYLKSKLSDAGIMSMDRIFADFGLSSQELEISGRGFSFQKDEPLYMTFQSEIDKDTFTAADLINNLSVSNLEKIFQVYGDERNAWKIANAIVEARESTDDLAPKKIKVVGQKNYPINTTKQLVEIIEKVSPRHGKTHPATKVFQAIRIAVNDEYESIKEFVNDSFDTLNPGGVLSIITFHSGEDRIVKNMFKAYETKNNKQEKVKPGRTEVKENKRSRSAILRTIKKI